MGCGNFPSGTMHFARIGGALESHIFEHASANFGVCYYSFASVILKDVRSNDGERYYTAPPCYRGKTNWGPMHFRIIFLTTVAKVLPIYIFRIRNRVLVPLYVMVFVFGFCNSKASTQTTRICTCNYSTLHSYASNKQLPTLVTLRKARRAKIQSRKIYGDSKCVSNFWRSFVATWQKLKQEFQKRLLACSQEELQTVMSNLLSQRTNSLLLMKITRQTLLLKNRTSVYLYRILSKLRLYLDVIISPVLLHPKR